ncbi:MAG TPA: hypothetical protein VFL82_13070 [Thermomicrobiales bacterium]|nr:hypothetical protein [Thermomicrobiales bacterium]
MHILIGSLVIVALLIVLGLLNTGTLQNRLVAPAKITARSSPAGGLTGQERAYYQYVQPRLMTVDAESRKLADLGRQKSRNLLEIETRGNRVTKAAGEIDTYVTDHGVPPKFARSYESYQQGVENVRAAMKTARAALFSFNFDQVPAAVAQFDAGTLALDQALLQLQRESGLPTYPVSTSTPAAG